MIGKITEIPFNMFQEHAECHSSDFSSVCGLSVCFVVGFGKCFGLLSVVQYRSSFPGPLSSNYVAPVGNDHRTEWMANQMVVCTSVHNYFAYRYLPPILMLITCLEGCTRIYVLNDHMQGHKRPHAFPSFV